MMPAAQVCIGKQQNKTLTSEIAGMDNARLANVVLENDKRVSIKMPNTVVCD